MKKKEPNNIPYTFFSFFLRTWSGTVDSSSVWYQDCVWRRDLGMGVLWNQCILVWKGDAVIILVCSEGRTVVELWHATLLHSLCSNENWNTPGVHEARRQRVTAAPVHDHTTALSLIIITSSSMLDPFHLLVCFASKISPKAEVTHSKPPHLHSSKP